MASRNRKIGVKIYLAAVVLIAGGLFATVLGDFGTAHVKAEATTEDDPQKMPLTDAMQIAARNGEGLPEVLEIRFAFETDEVPGGLAVYAHIGSGETAKRHKLALHIPFHPADENGTHSASFSIPSELAKDLATGDVVIEVAIDPTLTDGLVPKRKVTLKAARLSGQVE